MAYQLTPVNTLLVSSSYTYGDTTHKHAVTSHSTGETYTYDANGNTLAPGASAGVITRVEGGLTYTQTFDAENRLVSVTVSGQTTQFIYDGDGNMVKKVKPDGSKTIYVGGLYEVDKTSGGTVTRTVTYYPAGGAMRINIAGGSNSVYYILKDHLGSASVVTNASGVTLGEQRYYPYGETRLSTGTIYTDKLFTGQREGIYHYGGMFFIHLSLPYMKRYLYRLKMKDRLEIKALLQSILDPVQAQTKQTFVNALGSINQGKVVFCNDLQSLADHPNISQTCGNQHSTEASRVRQMAFVNIETSAFLVGKESLDAEATAINNDKPDTRWVGWRPERWVLDNGCPTNQSHST